MDVDDIVAAYLRRRLPLPPPKRRTAVQRTTARDTLKLPPQDLPQKTKSPGKEERDYYRDLGVPQNATQNDIKIAYIRRKLLYAPEKQARGNRAEAAAEFEKIREAYHILKNKSKRAEYDKSYSFPPSKFCCNDFFQPSGAGEGNSYFEVCDQRVKECKEEGRKRREEAKKRWEMKLEGVKRKRDEEGAKEGVEGTVKRQR